MRPPADVAILSRDRHGITALKERYFFSHRGQIPIFKTSPQEKRFETTNLIHLKVKKLGLVGKRVTKTLAIHDGKTCPRLPWAIEVFHSKRPLPLNDHP